MNKEEINNILEKYAEWRGENDDAWEYDMIHEFFEAHLTRGEMQKIIAFLREQM